MKLPVEWLNTKEWTIVGPMGPQVDSTLLTNPVLCVDGGAKFSTRMDIWVGDGDSHQDPVDCPSVFKFPPKKASSDLALALSLFQDSTKRTLHCWGFLGGRRDHELLNLGEVLHFLDHKSHSEVFFYSSETGKIVVRCYGHGAWHFHHQGVFSVTCLRSNKIQIHGDCEYPLHHSTELPPLSSLGLSNQAFGDVKIICDHPVMVIFPEMS